MVVCKLESAIWRDPLGDRSMASRQGKESKIPSNSRGFRSSLVDPHSAAPSVAVPFAAITILLGRYRWTGEWLLCRIFCRDDPGTYTVVWQDGFLQVGTPSQDLRSFSPLLVKRIMSHIVKGRDERLPDTVTQAAQGTTQTKGSIEPMTDQRFERLGGR